MRDYARVMCFDVVAYACSANVGLQEHWFYFSVFCGSSTLTCTVKTQNEKCLSVIKKTYLLTKFLSVEMYCLKANILLKTSRCCVRFTLLIRSSNAL